MLTITEYTGFGAGDSQYNPAAVTGLAIWYDFSDTSYLTTSGTRITAIAGKGGTGGTATGTISGTWTSYPKYSSAAQNGLSAARCDLDSAAGANPFFSVGLVNTSTADFGTAWAGFSMMGVAQLGVTTASQNNYLFEIENGTNVHFTVEHGYNVSGGTMNEILSIYDNLTFSSSSFCAIGGTANPWCIYAISEIPKIGGVNGSGTYRRDGGQLSATGTLTNTQDTYSVLHLAQTSARANTFVGLIGEMRFFNGALDLSAIQKEEGYLAWKWGLQGNLPSNHPYKNAPP